MADDVAVLGLSVDSSAAVNGMKTFTREVGGMTSAVKSAALALTSLFATAKITQFINGTSAAFASYGDQMAKMSQRLDIAASKLSEMSYVASQSGTSIETFEKGVRLLQRNLNSADEEAKTAVAAFEKLGLSIQELKQMSPDEQFKSVASAIASLESPSERTAYAMKIFSRSGAEMIPFFQQGREGMEKLSEKARKLGFVMSDKDYKAAVDLTDAMDTFHKSIDAVRNALVAGLAPSLTEMYEKISSSAAAVVDFIREHELLVKTVLKLGTAVAGITAVYGAYKILQTTMLAQKALRATLAAQTAQNIVQTTAETTALTANTAAQLANNAAKGAGVATGVGKKAAGMLGGGGAAAFAFTALAAGAVNNFIDGFKRASKEGAGIFSKSVKGVINSATFGLATIGSKWKEAAGGGDVGIERTKLLANTFTLGISGVTEKLAEMLGITTTIRDLLLAADNDYQAEVERGADLDAKLAASNERIKTQDTVKRYLEDGREDFRDTDEWTAFQDSLDNRRRQLTLTGTDAAKFDSDLAKSAMSEADWNARKWERDYTKANDAAQKAFDEMERAEENYLKVNAATSGDYSDEADRKRAAARSAVSAAKSEYEDAQKNVDALSGPVYKEVMDAQLKAQEDFLAASANYSSAFNDEEIRKRDERIAREDSELQSKYTGTQSDEAAAERSKQEVELLAGRLKEMEDAAKRVEEIRSELKDTTDLKEIASLRQQLELNEQIAGSLEDRLSISDEITQKNAEQEQALSRIAEKEKELARSREQRNDSLKEQAQGLAENYAAKWMNDSEKVQFQRGKLADSMAEAEQFGYREQKINDMDEMIKLLGRKAGQGGDEGRKAEEEMNRLIKERAEAEEQLYADKKQNMDEQYAALNAIDDIAGSKAEKYMQDYQKEMEAWTDAQKKDRESASIQKAVDAASAEGFAQMNRVYDTSQKKIEDHTKNIKEYTRQMKQYLMQLAARGDTSWALDVEGA